MLGLGKLPHNASRVPRLRHQGASCMLYVVGCCLSLTHQGLAGSGPRVFVQAFSASLCQTLQMAPIEPLPHPAGDSQKTDRKAQQTLSPAASEVCSAAPAPLPSLLPSAWRLPPGPLCCWDAVQQVPSADRNGRRALLLYLGWLGPLHCYKDGQETHGHLVASTADLSHRHHHSGTWGGRSGLLQDPQKASRASVPDTDSTCHIAAQAASHLDYSQVRLFTSAHR